ncbi:hypothetical protein ACJRO7_029857 [Eucalyptus globulus]|uniref:Sieve element occlusion N-terminal domain-containing protein n=1 Tax=Eucalyptus globulus TaxID=34317 RepID=A0ABD3JCG7_EUCGL
MASIVTSSAIINFINNHQFIDTTIGKQVYDSSIEEKCNVNDLQEIVNNILRGVFPLVDESHEKVSNDISQTIISSEISRVIHEIRSQMACKAERGRDAEERLRGIFSTLSSYRWTTQLLLVLAAFAQQYGEFWYISKDPSEGGNALLKGLSSLKKKLISDKKAEKEVPLNEVVVDLLDWTNSLVNLEKLVTQHRGKRVPILAEAFRTMPKWSCQAIIAIVAAGDYFAWLMDDDKSAEPLELHTLASSVLALLWDCKREIDRIDRIDRMKEYHKYVEKVKATGDIVDFLNSLLTAKDSFQDPIVTGPNDKPVRFELFSKKSVLLIISHLKISMDDIETLRIIYEDPQRLRKSPKEDDQEDSNNPIQTEKETLYELVWIPIVDGRLKDWEALPNLKSLMPWAYRVDPQRMNTWAPKYIKEEWHFKRETMVVVLDSHGRVENTDAMPMLRIWGTNAFPYTGNEFTHPWMGIWSWVQLVLRELVVQHGTSDAAKDEYILFWGPPAVEVAAADAGGGVPSIREIPIEDMRRFRTLLRSCLICRLQAVQILKIESNPLRDRMVYEMSEAYKACQRGGVAILTKGPDLQVQHVGLLSDIEMATEQVAEFWWTALAEGFEKKYKDAQGQSMCLHAYVPHYTDLEDLYCPVCGRFMRYDLCLMCCHSDSD